MATCKKIVRSKRARQDRAARQLIKLSGGQLVVTYEPDTFIDEELDAERKLSQGHLYCATLPIDLDDEWELMWLDDRRGDLATQLVTELRRVATRFLSIADGIESKTKRLGRRAKADLTTDTHNLCGV